MQVAIRWRPFGIPRLHWVSAHSVVGLPYQIRSRCYRLHAHATSPCCWATYAGTAQPGSAAITSLARRRRPMCLARWAAAESCAEPHVSELLHLKLLRLCRAGCKCMPASTRQPVATGARRTGTLDRSKLPLLPLAGSMTVVTVQCAYALPQKKKGPRFCGPRYHCCYLVGLAEVREAPPGLAMQLVGG